MPADVDLELTGEPTEHEPARPVPAGPEGEIPSATRCSASPPWHTVHSIPADVAPERAGEPTEHEPARPVPAGPEGEIAPGYPVFRITTVA